MNFPSPPNSDWGERARVRGAPPYAIPTIATRGTTLTLPRWRAGPSLSRSAGEGLDARSLA